MSPKIREILEKFKKSGRLPSPKGVALQLLGMTRDDQVNIDDLVRLVKADPALTGRIIKFANSSGLAHHLSVYCKLLPVENITKMRTDGVGWDRSRNWRKK